MRFDIDLFRLFKSWRRLLAIIIRAGSILWTASGWRRRSSSHSGSRDCGGGSSRDCARRRALFSALFAFFAQRRRRSCARFPFASATDRIDVVGVVQQRRSGHCQAVHVRFVLERHSGRKARRRRQILSAAQDLDWTGTTPFHVRRGCWRQSWLHFDLVQVRRCGVRYYLHRFIATCSTTNILSLNYYHYISL